MKARKRAGEEAIDVYEGLKPTVVTCLSQLTTELQDLLAWAEAAGVEHEVWGLNPVAYLGDSLKLRNPARAAAAVQKALTAASSETASETAAPAAEAPAATEGAEMAAMPLEPTSGFSKAEANTIIEKLRAGATFSAGCRQPLLRVDGKEARAHSELAARCVHTCGTHALWKRPAAHALRGPRRCAHARATPPQPVI